MSIPIAPGTLVIQLDHTEAEAASQANAVGYPDVESAAEAVARALGQDLRHLVRVGHVDLGRALGMPPDVVADPTVVAELVLADLERLLRMHLVIATHLVICEQDPNIQREVVASYCAPYAVRGTVALSGNAPWSAIANAPARSLADAHVILCVTWRTGLAYDRARNVRPPEFAYVWTPRPETFLGGGPLRYQFVAAPHSPQMVARTEPVAFRYRAAPTGPKLSA